MEFELYGAAIGSGALVVGVVGALIAKLFGANPDQTFGVGAIAFFLAVIAGFFILKKYIRKQNSVR